MNALASSTLALLSMVILFGPRRWASLGLVAGVVYLTQGTALIVAGFNLFPARVLLLVGLLRAALRRDFYDFEVNRLDRVVVLLYAYSVGVFLLRSNEYIVFQIGTAVDALLSYFLFRMLVKSLDDMHWLLSRIAVLLVPYAALVWVETITANNPFALVGGAQNALGGDMWFREGRLRATGTFAHPSLMGTLGGSFLPMYIGLWFFTPKRSVAALGIGVCLALVLASNSGGPAVCVIAATVGWLLWPARNSMRGVRIALVAGFVLLALVMKAPIWYVMAKVSSVIGGDGWHRGALLEVAFANLDRWWLAGMPLSGTAYWLPYTNSTTGYVDITNTFLQFGLTSGLGAVALLVLLFIVAFSQIGRSMRLMRERPGPSAAMLERFFWGLGVTLAVHLLNWFSITYFDQTNYIWFAHLALVSTLTGQALSRNPTRPRTLCRTHELGSTPNPGGRAPPRPMVRGPLQTSRQRQAPYQGGRHPH